MSTKTTNFEFIKPELTDPANITVTNENWDNLDETLKQLVTTKHCYGSLEEIGITDGDFPISCFDLFQHIPDNSMLILSNASLYKNSSMIVMLNVNVNVSGDEATICFIKSSGCIMALYSGEKIPDEKDPGRQFAYIGYILRGGDQVWINLKDVAPKYTYGTIDLTAGTSQLETGKLHFVYE